MRLRLLLVSTLLVALQLGMGASADDTTELSWKQLAPAGDIEKLASAQVMALLRAAPHGSLEDSPGSMQAIQPGLYDAVQAWDGANVRISGFVVPLDFDRGESREFLLVPYYGACIHAPPPPPNQIIYVSSATPVTIGSLSDAHMIEGVLAVSSNSSAMGDSSYRLELASIEKLDPNQSRRTGD